LKAIYNSRFSHIIKEHPNKSKVCGFFHVINATSSEKLNGAALNYPTYDKKGLGKSFRNVATLLVAQGVCDTF
jgi:hypothetical protein